MDYAEHMSDSEHALQPSLFGTTTPSAPETFPRALPGLEGADLHDDLRQRPGPFPVPVSATGLEDAAGAFDDHLARLAKTVNTRRGFASDLRLLAEYLDGGRPIGTITTDDLNAFLVWLLKYRGPACSPKSYARRVTTIKVFFAWLAEAGAIDKDPALPVVHRPAEPPLPQVLSDAEVATLLALAHARLEAVSADPRPALVLRLLLDTGLKKGELTRLRADDIATDADPPTLLVRYDNPRWREKERRVAFSPHVLPILTAYLARYRCGDLLFGCTDRNLEYVLADLVRSAGLPEHTGFETLRWTSALRHWRSGVDPEALREQLGLSPITWATTQRKLDLLDGGTAKGARVARFFPEPLS